MPSGPKNPIFVMGAQGSGTTLMRLILDSHDDIAMAQETGFARALLATEHIPYVAFGDTWYRRIGLSRDDLERELAQFYDRLFSRFAAQRGATRWGDKTPFHVWYLPLLARVFPDAVFIGMVRHPGAGASSRSRRMGHGWGSSLRQWTRRNTEMLYQGSLLGDRFLVCRYEDLVTRPEPVLRELLEWLDVPWSDRVRTFHDVHRERGTPSQVEGWTLSDEPLDASRVDAWTREMTDERWIQLKRGKVRALARFLGYRPDRPMPQPDWGGASSGVLVDGLGLRRLMEERPGVDWAVRPRPSLPNRPLTIQDLRALKKRAAGARRQPAAVQRVGQRLFGVARRVLLLLPARPRRRLRSVWWTVRLWVRRGQGRPPRAGGGGRPKP